MSNFFEDVVGNLDKLEQELLGPDYAYYKQIKTPQELGMTDHGSISALSDDIIGLVAYTKILVQGGGKASKAPGALGDRFFLETGAKCKDTKSKQQVTRSIYINNIPDGDIPFISAGMGEDYTTFEGLIPGSIGSLAHINPLAIFQGFLEGINPDCTATKLEVIDASNNAYYDTKYLTITDIKNMNPCWFPDNRNPITKKYKSVCNKTRVQPFKNLNEPIYSINQYSTGIAYLYFASLLLLFCYLLIKKKRR